VAGFDISGVETSDFAMTVLFIVKCKPNEINV
jgi:hypothetical protein